MFSLAFALIAASLAPAAELAPPPRPKTDHATCYCADGDLRCRARAALALKARAASQTVPTSAEVDAVKRILERKAAEKK